MVKTEVFSPAGARSPSRGWRRALWLIASIAALVSFGCGSPGRYVWVQSLPPAPVAATGSYVIDDADMLDIRVYGEDRLSGPVRVRTDGKITLPLLGDIEARGKTPAGLAAELQARLQRFLKEPTVTIGITETHPIHIAVLGEVKTPGVFQLPQRSGVLEALAIAGGLTENADRDSIFVVRKQPALRVRFTYETLMSADSRAAAAFPLQGGDVVTVE